MLVKGAALEFILSCDDANPLLLSLLFQELLISFMSKHQDRLNVVSEVNGMEEVQLPLSSLMQDNDKRVGLLARDYRKEHQESSDEDRKGPAGGVSLRGDSYAAAAAAAAAALPAIIPASFRSLATLHSFAA